MPSNMLCKDSCTSQLNCTAGRGWVVLHYGVEWEEGCGEGRGEGGELGGGGGGRGGGAGVHSMLRWPSATIVLRELW